MLSGIVLYSQCAHADTLCWDDLASNLVKGQGPFMAVHPRAYRCQWISPDEAEHLCEHLASTLILRWREWHLRLRHAQEAAEDTGVSEIHTVHPFSLRHQYCIDLLCETGPFCQSQQHVVPGELRLIRIPRMVSMCNKHMRPPHGSEAGPTLSEASSHPAASR